MSRRGTPTKGRAKSVPVCEDVPAEFCKRVLCLMASFYDTPSTSEITTFPPAKKADPQSPPKKLEFESSITDLRVKRAQEANSNTISQINNSINERVDQIAEKFRNSNIDLDDIFAPESVIRPDIPKYLLNQQLDEEFELESRKRNRSVRPIDMRGIEKEQTVRLQSAKKKGQDRAKKRFEKQQNQTPTPTKSYYRSQAFKKEDEKSAKVLMMKRQEEAKNRRSKTAHFKKPEEYHSYIKSTKTPDKKQQKYFNSEDESD